MFFFHFYNFEMALVLFPPTTPILSSTSHLPTTSNNLYIHTSSQTLSTFPYQSSIRSRFCFSSRRTSLLSVPIFNAKNSEPNGAEDPRALQTVLKLYTAIKNKDIGELSDLIGEECRCVCNFFSLFQPLQGKKVRFNFN